MSKNANKNSVSGQNDEKIINKSKTVLQKPEDYSPSSTIYKAYSNGIFPAAHKILFNAICRALNGKSEGNVDFNAVLEDAQMHRSSALQIIKHMTAWGILSVSFNSTQIIGEQRKSWAFVTILNNPEAPVLPKSA